MDNTEKYLEIEKIADLSEKLNISTGLTISSIITGLEDKNYDGIKINNNNFFALQKGSSSLGIYSLNNLFKTLIESDEVKIIFLKEIKINIGKYKGFYFNRCVFEGDIIFDNIFSEGNIIFSICEIKENLKFKNSDFEGKLEISHTNIFGKCKLNSVSFKKGIYIGLEGNSVMNINEIVLDNIFIKSPKEIILFSNFDVKVFKIYNLRILENIIFSNIELGLLSFENTDLGRTTFNGVKIEKLYLENTTLNDCIFNGVEFPENYELEKRNNTDILSNKQLKDNYRQLKFVMDKNGNYTEGNKFYEKEMEYYLRSLNIKKEGFFKTFKKLFEGNFLGENAKKKGEEIVLLFGWNINDFGNNWLRSLEAIILLALSSSIFDLISTLLGVKYGNYYGDIIFVGILIFMWFIIFKTKVGVIFDEKIGKKINILNLIGFLFFGLIFISFFISNFDGLKVFGNLLNPLYLKEKGVEYNGIEIFGMVLYKTIYGILLWHLIVALKRTTKR